MLSPDVPRNLPLLSLDAPRKFICFLPISSLLSLVVPRIRSMLSLDVPRNLSLFSLDVPRNLFLLSLNVRRVLSLLSLDVPINLSFLSHKGPSSSSFFPLSLSCLSFSLPLFPGYCWMSQGSSISKLGRISASGAGEERRGGDLYETIFSQIENF